MPRERRAGGGIDRLPSGRYRVRIVTTDGRRLSLGTHPTKRAAEAAYARSVTEQADGKRATPSAVTTPTFGDYASGWVDTRLTKRGEALRPRVKDLYLMQLRLHIVPTFGTTRLARITTAQVRDSNAGLRGPDGPGASTAAKCYRLLRSILTTAVEDGLIPANPCTIKGAGVEPADERPIPTVAQVHDLVEQLPDRMRGVALLAAFFGLRRGEILGLRRGDVDLDRCEIAIVRQHQLDRHGNHLVGPPKSDAGRRVLAIPAALLTDLRDHLDTFAQPGEYGYDFTGQKGGPLAPHVWQDAWEKARTEVGVSEIHLHDLRHLAGTLAASTGASTKEVMYRLGHATHQAALRYQHATRQRDRAIADALDQMLQFPGEGSGISGSGLEHLLYRKQPLQVVVQSGVDEQIHAHTSFTGRGLQAVIELRADSDCLGDPVLVVLAWSSRVGHVTTLTTALSFVVDTERIRADSREDARVIDDKNLGEIAPSTINSGRGRTVASGPSRTRNKRAPRRLRDEGLDQTERCPGRVRLPRVVPPEASRSPGCSRDERASDACSKAVLGAVPQLPVAGSSQRGHPQHTRAQGRRRDGRGQGRESERSELIICRMDGTIEDKRTYGDDPFPPRG